MQITGMCRCVRLPSQPLSGLRMLTDADSQPRSDSWPRLLSKLMSRSSRDMTVLCGGIEHLVGSNAPCYGIQRGELEVIGVSSRTECTKYSPASRVIGIPHDEMHRVWIDKCPGGLDFSAASFHMGVYVGNLYIEYNIYSNNFVCSVQEPAYNIEPKTSYDVHSEGSQGRAITSILPLWVA